MLKIYKCFETKVSPEQIYKILIYNINFHSKKKNSILNDYIRSHYN